MKYYTKEFYALIDAGCLHMDFVASPSAKRKSENYFRHLYAEREKAWLDAKHQEAEECGAVFDEAAEKTAFKTDYQKKMLTYTTTFSPDILEQVADIRVMALGSCSSKVKQMVTKFCKHQMDLAQSMELAFNEYWEKYYHRIPDRILENYGFHYCTVTALGRDGDNIIMTVDNSKSNDDVNTVIWKNAQFLELEEGVVGAEWRENELYKRPEGGYEFHAVLEADDGELLYLTIQAEDIDFRFDEKPEEPIEE